MNVKVNYNHLNSSIIAYRLSSLFSINFIRAYRFFFTPASDFSPRANCTIACFATRRNHALTHPRKPATFHVTLRSNVARIFVRIIAEYDGSDLELCVPRWWRGEGGRGEGEDARKDARGQLRRGEEAFFVIGKVCRRKVSIYSLRRTNYRRFLLPRFFSLNSRYFNSQLLH